MTRHVLAARVKRALPQDLRNQLRPMTDAADRMRVFLRLGLGRRGRLPDFLILGAQKAGTTSLYDLLVQHPRIETARTKEIAFFDRHYGLGINWYKCNFPANGQITGEATPDYLVDPEAFARIQRHLPQRTRFIVLLRNPVDRLVSHYFHARRLGYEPLGLAEALECEAERIGPQGHRLVGHPLEGRTQFSAFSYYTRGLYAEQLQRWFDGFGRENVFVETSDRFFADPVGVTRQVFGFLRLDDYVPPVVEAQNIGTYGSRIDPEIYRTLSDRYREPNRQLDMLLGRKLGWSES